MIYTYIYFSFFSICDPKGKKINNGALQFLKEETKTFLAFAEYFLLALDEYFCCWLVDRGVKNAQTNILIFKFIILHINYSVLIKI